MKGTYFLVVKCLEDCNVTVGALGKIGFSKGLYVYVGSAMNSIEKRVARHLKKVKVKKWHIDYLTTNKNFEVEKVYYKKSGVKKECNFSLRMMREFEGVERLGCSDCKCSSHLYKVSAIKMKNFAEENKLEVLRSPQGVPRKTRRRQ